MNSFEKSAQIYLGIQGGFSTPGDKPTTVFTSGILEVDSPDNVGRKMQLGTDTSNTAYIDFKSLDGSTSDYDSRFISLGGATGNASGGGQLVMQANIVEAWAPMRIGSGFAPAFRMDFGQVSAPGGVNQDAFITFTAGMGFTSPPKVIVSLFDSDGPTANPGGDLTPYIYDVTVLGASVRGLGTQNATSIFYNWIAIGA